MTKELVDIILAVPIPGAFSYLIPKHLSKVDLKIGARVLVPFGNRTMVGIVHKHSNNNINKSIKYKEIKSLIDKKSVIDNELLSLAEWASRYYHYPIGEVVSYFMTPSLRRGEEAAFSLIDIWHITTKGEFSTQDALKKSPKQQDAMNTFKDLKSLTRITAKAYGISSSILRSLEDKLFIVRAKTEIIPSYNSIKETENKKKFNEEQKKAIKKIQEGSDNQVYLLNGITGSGKTEVYMEAILEVIEKGSQALVLIPEIGLTPQTEDRFKKRFGSKVVSMHSNKNDRERLDAWIAASRGLVDVVIGTRSSVFTPFLDLGMIVVDEEHDLSYKQAERFRYSARDIAIYRAKLLNIPLILASATPSLESIKNSLDNKYSLIELKKRATGAELPLYKSIDLRGKDLINGFSEELLKEIDFELQNKNQVLIFINRRGYAPAIICEFCGWIELCQSCDASMTIHSNPFRALCHHCEVTKEVPKNCTNCGKLDFNYLGVGTQKVEEFLKERFSSYPVIRVDRDTTRKKVSMEDYLNQVNSGKPMILVGTQILAKGHHFPDVTLVGIMDADSGLFSADFRGSERVAQLITQVAGRAGREKKNGKVFLQTYFPDHPQIEELVSGNYQNFLNRILEERLISGTPPFSYQARFQAESAQGKLAQDFLYKLRQLVKDNKKFRVVGPIPSIMERKASVYRWELNIYSTTRQPLHHKLEEIVYLLYKQKKISKVRWSLDVDPIGVW